MLAFAIQGDGTVWPVLQTALDQVGQDGAGANLDKGAHPSGVHGLDLFGKAHRLGNLAGQGFADGVGHAGIDGGHAVGVDRQQRLVDADVLQKGAEGRRSRTHDRRMERGRDRQPLEANPSLLQFLFGRLDGALDAGNDDLIGAVVVGDDDPRVPAGQQRRHRIGGMGNGGHRAGEHGGGFGHQLAPFAGDREEGFAIKRPCRMQRGHFAEAVAARPRRA